MFGLFSAYRVAAEKLAQGPSRGARILLGVAAAVTAAVSALMAATDPQAQPAFGLFAGFCALIALACVLRGAAAHIMGRLLGALVFALSVAYLVDTLSRGVWWRWGEPSVFSAGCLVIAAGLPGLLFAVFGRVGLRARRIP